MTSRQAELKPIAELGKSTSKLYALYRQLHDSFGGLSKSRRSVARHEELLDIKYAPRMKRGDHEKSRHP